MTGYPNQVYSGSSLVHKSNRLLSQQLSIGRESSADIVVSLVLANEAMKISRDQSTSYCVHTYGADERLLKYCFFGSPNRFSTYRISNNVRQQQAT